MRPLQLGGEGVGEQRAPPGRPPGHLQLVVRDGIAGRHRTPQAGEDEDGVPAPAAGVVGQRRPVELPVEDAGVALHRRQGRGIGEAELVEALERRGVVEASAG